MLELGITSGLGLLIIALLLWHLPPPGRQRAADLVERLQANLQESLSGSRRELFGMVTALQQGVDQRLSDNLTQHSTLFRDMAEKLGEIRVTNERIIAISQDINQLSRILESPKLRGHIGEFELERMLRNVLPPA